MKATILAFFVIAFSVNQAYAVSREVRIACRDDYFAHCSMHAVGSPGVRQCMREVGPRLSQQCISALAASGEIKKEKIALKKKYYAKKTVSTKHVANRHTKKTYASKKTIDKKYADKKQYSKKRYTKKDYRGKQYAKATVRG